MQLRGTKKGYVVALEKGDEIITSLTEVMNKRGIHGAHLHGIGQFESATLGFYDGEAQAYEWKEVDGPLEIASLTGTMSRTDGEPVVHCHGVLSDRDFNCVGGHIKQAVVSITAEIFITEVDFPIHRKPDSETGLDLFAIQ